MILHPLAYSETQIAAWFAGILGVFAAIGRGGKWLLERRDRLQRERQKREDALRAAEVKRQLQEGKELEMASWRAHSKLMNELTHILQAADCCRVLLIKAANGGGIPGPGATVAVTIEAEVSATIVPSMLDYQRRRMDLSYSHMVTQLIRDKRLLLETEQLDPAGMLHQTYQANGILRSWVFKVALAKGAFFYISLNFTKPGETELTPQVLEAVSSSINRIRPLLGLAYEVFPLDSELKTETT